jgi:hypothetical protein
MSSLFVPHTGPCRLRFGFAPWHYCSECDRWLWLRFYLRLPFWFVIGHGYGGEPNDVHCLRCHRESLGDEWSQEHGGVPVCCWH